MEVAIRLVWMMTSEPIDIKNVGESVSPHEAFHSTSQRQLKKRGMEMFPLGHLPNRYPSEITQSQRLPAKCSNELEAPLQPLPGTLVSLGGEPLEVRLSGSKSKSF